ncbi:MAG: ATP-dependent DNA helicase RecG [Candidatus Gracilibacteria bacterium]|nr:ATP-dependent DNA helicase RecG [Candidatus Gracilibacteria bacterium]
MLSTLISKSLLHTTDNYIKSLNKGGILSVGDLLNHFPRDFEDRTNVLDTFSLINIKEKNTILLKLINISNNRTANNKVLTKAIFEDKNGFLAEAVWFNRDYLSRQLEKHTNKQVLVIGKVKYEYGKLSFVSPEVERDLSKIAGEVVPIYPDLNYIPGKWIEGKMELVAKYIDYIDETLPDDIIKKYNFISKKEAYKLLHFPKTKQDIEIAKFRLGYEELYNINFTSIEKKYENINFSEGKALAIPLDPELVKEIISKISFELTNAQKISLFQVLKDMEKTHSMQRLLEGDVGTGKTIVALIAAIHAILQTRKNGNSIQLAIMAPTEILARQHFEGISEMLLQFGISSHLLVGSTTAKQKEKVKADIKQGNIDVVVGTHALLQESVVFKNLGFVVIDEQHRFGVKQREVLEKGLGNLSYIVPHSLNMTATPIPRTLALTIYGDQDLSILNEYPKDRKIIHTKVLVSEGERRQIELFVRNELEKGRQVFWISPLVEESEKLDLANAISTYESLVDIFSPFKVGLLHGKMKPKEKEEIMREFAENNIQILSSTSVVEVGINIPNATIMCIEGAERFGLSQLHQFRGRVGRGKYQSYCYLFPSKGQKTDRLKAMEKTNNGFELSEIDLNLRGPGEVYGVKQSGVPDLKIASLTDLALISDIREDIDNMFRQK